MAARPVVILFLFVMLGVSWAASCVLYRAAEVGELVAPLETRSFASMSVIAVGTGGSYENPERLGPSMAVAKDDHVALVDAGRGIAEALRASKIPVSQPSVVFLTSLMPESVVGIDDLLAMGWLDSRSAPLRLIGPRGTRVFAEALERAMREGVRAQGESLALPEDGVRIEVSEAGDGWSEVIGGIEVTAGSITGGPSEALAWKFQADHDSVVISGVGWGTDDLVSFAKNADLLVHEAVYIPRPEDIEEAGVIADPDRLVREAAIHTSVLDVGAIADRANVDALALIRMRPPPFFRMQVTGIVSDSFDGTIIVPDDGDEIWP